MSHGKRKYDGIDLLALYTAADFVVWNAFLTDCHAKHNIQKLQSTYYGLQVGMDNLVKQKLNTQKIDEWFLRLQRSIENTLKRILREKYPNPCDQPMIAKEHAKFLESKRARDIEFESFLKKARF